MSGGWQGSNRKATLPNGWPRTRRRILKRDGYCCTWQDDERLVYGMGRWVMGIPDPCDAPATDVDHIGDPNDHSDANLRSLCSPHHDKRSSAQGNAARWAKAIPRARPQPQHPGLT